MNRFLTMAKGAGSFLGAPHRRKWVVSSVFLLLFLLSISAFLLKDRPMGRFILYFPHQKYEYMSGEERYLPLYGSRPETMELLMKENLLGPVRPEHNPLFGPGTRVRSFIFEGGQAYLDLSPEATFSWNANNYWTMEEAFQAMEDTLRLNFKEVSELSVTVSGQVPFRENSEKK